MDVTDSDWDVEKPSVRGPWQHPLAYEPERPRDWGVTVWAIILAVVMFSWAMSGAGWERPSQSQHPLPSPQNAPTDEQVTTPPSYEKPRASETDPQETLHVAKCVVNGRATYSAQSDCRGSSAVVSIRPSSGELEGGFSQYELQMLQSADARIAQDQAVADSRPVTPTAEISSKRARCAALDQQIATLDARSRMPISGHEQEVIRAERADARSRQFALRC